GKIRYLQERLKVRQEMGWGGFLADLEMVHMGVARVAHPVDWTTSEGLTIALFLRVVLAVEVEGLNASLLLEHVRANLRGI
ncbi:hypothetical protein RJ639_023306, partial [Escallonia herrerae]